MLTKKLGEEKSRKDSGTGKTNAMNGPEMQLYEIQSMGLFSVETFCISKAFL